MADVFISHSSKDKEIADRLCAFLEHNGLKCWIAPRDIEPGSEWPVAISEAIQNVKVMVVIYSYNTATSTQVPKELTLADKRKKKIIPYKIDDAELSGSFEYFLASAHWIVANRLNPQESMSELVRVISSMIGKTAVKSQAQVQSTANLQQVRPATAFQGHAILQQPERKPLQQGVRQPVQKPVQKQSQAAVRPQSEKNVTQQAQASVKQTAQSKTLNMSQVVSNRGTESKKTKKKTGLIFLLAGGGALALLLLIAIFVGVIIIGAGVGSGQSTTAQNDYTGVDGQSASIQISPAEDFEYVLNENGVSITAYVGNSAEVVVPAEIEGKPVYEIGFNAFRSNKIIKSVLLPNSITSIRTAAFFESSLESIMLPNNLKCIENSVFYKCTNLKQITLPNTVTSIDGWAFSETGLTEIVLPDSVTKIMPCAFINSTNLSKVTFSKNLRSIGVAAFRNTALTDVRLPESVTYLGGEAFSFCSNLQSFEFSDNITYIPASFFTNSINLNSVVFPNNLMMIESFAFEYTSLENVDLTNCPLRYIGVGAFGDCALLTNVQLPETIIKIDKNAFQSCTNLQDVNLPRDIKLLSSNVFFQVPNVNITYKGANYSAAEMDIFTASLNERLCKDFKYSVSENGIRIDEYVGSESEVVIPDNIGGSDVTIIGNNAFANKNMITFVSIPNSVTEVEYEAFISCSELALVGGGEQVEYLGNSAFFGSGLVKAFIPRNLSEIQQAVFFGCNNLTEVHLPNNVSVIHSNAFSDCKSLIDFSCGDNIQAISDDAFEGSINMNIWIPFMNYTYEDIELIPILVPQEGV